MVLGRLQRSSRWDQGLESWGEDAKPQAADVAAIGVADASVPAGEPSMRTATEQRSEGLTTSCNPVTASVESCTARTNRPASLVDGAMNWSVRVAAGRGWRRKVALV